MSAAVTLRRCAAANAHALIVVAHPDPASLSHALAAAVASRLAADGCTVAWHDLYAERFDPVQRSGEGEGLSSSDALVESHCAELAQAEFIGVFHPNWWGQPPAIMKGWIDRVFRLDTAYGYPPGVPREGVPVGLLRARRALVVNTCNTPPEREAAVFGDPLEAIWKRCVFGLCGVADVERRMIGPVSGSTPAQRATWLAEVAALAAGWRQLP